MKPSLRLKVEDRKFEIRREIYKLNGELCLNPRPSTRLAIEDKIYDLLKELSKLDPSINACY